MTPAAPSSYPDVAPPAGAVTIDDWQPNYPQSFRVVFGPDRTITADPDVRVWIAAVQFADGHIDDGYIQVRPGPRAGLSAVGSRGRARRVGCTMTTTHDEATAWRELTDDLAFENVVSIWRQPLPCQVTTGGQCQQPAQWRLDVHGCEEKLICTNHLRSWEAHVVRVIERGGVTVCDLCTLRFAGLESVRKVLPL